MQKSGKSTPRVINSHKVPASGEVVNDGPQTALSHGKDRRFGSCSRTGAKSGTKTGRGPIRSGIGENPGKTALFPHISKTARGHYDSGMQ
jgi:hypothetical protein